MVGQGLQATRLRRRASRRARFVDLVQFVDNPAPILSHPVHGNLKYTALTTRRSSILQMFHPSLEKRSKSGFATSIAPITKVTVEGSHGPSSSSKMHVKPCLFCNGTHNLNSCSQINKKQNKTKKQRKVGVS